MLWSLGEFPELEHLESDERRQLLSKIPWWTYPLLISISSFTAIPISAIVVMLSQAPVFVVRWIVFLIAFLAIAISAYQILLGYLRAMMRQAIIKGFAGQRPPFCFRCGYDLRGTADGACPECGGQLA